MASITKCGHCGSRDTAVGGWHIHCLACNGYTDSEGNPVAQPSDHDTAA